MSESNTPIHSQSRDDRQDDAGVNNYNDDDIESSTAAAAASDTGFQTAAMTSAFANLQPPQQQQQQQQHRKAIKQQEQQQQQEADEKLQQLQERSSLQDAIAVIPGNLRAAYNEAVAKAPHLVESESAAEYFLRFDPDLLTAGRRLVTYWERRLEIFGPMASFFPLIQTGSGALTAQDLAGLNTAGCMLLLMQQQQQQQQQPQEEIVITYDVVSCEQQMDRDTLLHCLFYLLHVAMESESANNPGITVTVVTDCQHCCSSSSNINSTEISSNININSNISGLRNLRTFFELIKYSFPIRLQAVHFVNSNASQRGEFVRNAVPVLQEFCRDHISVATVVHMHADKSTLAEFLHPSTFPSSLGGTFAADEFLLWREERLLLERNRYESKPSPIATLSQSQSPSQTQPPPAKMPRVRDREGSSGSGSGSSSTVRLTNILVETSEPAEQKCSHEESPKLAPAALSKTASRPSETDMSKTSSSLYSSSSGGKAALGTKKKKQPRSGDHPLLMQAEEDGDSDKQMDFIRKRNALYSRRLYHKRKIEMSVLEEQTVTLQSQNADLRREQDRLESLLKSAQEMVTRFEGAGWVGSLAEGSPASNPRQQQQQHQQQQQQQTSEASPFSPQGLAGYSPAAFPADPMLMAAAAARQQQITHIPPWMQAQSLPPFFLPPQPPDAFTLAQMQGVGFPGAGPNPFSHQQQQQQQAAMMSRNAAFLAGQNMAPPPLGFPFFPPAGPPGLAQHAYHSPASFMGQNPFASDGMAMAGPTSSRMFLPQQAVRRSQHSPLDPKSAILPGTTANRRKPRSSSSTSQQQQQQQSQVPGDHYHHQQQQQQQQYGGGSSVGGSSVEASRDGTDADFLEGQHPMSRQRHAER